LEYRTLGRTRLQTSVLGLGGGGLSCFGLKQGGTEKAALAIIDRGLDAGINFIDTSDHNGTEPVCAKALMGGKRSQVILSTKRSVSKGDCRITAKAFSDSIDDSLRMLCTDWIDVFSFHGVFIDEYDYVLTELLPVVQKAREQGKVRFCGITEAFKWDTSHQMLQAAIIDDCWDVIMVGYNIINQSAQPLLDDAQRKNIGILGMYAVRNALKTEDSLSQVFKQLQATGQVAADMDINAALDRLFCQDDGGRSTMTELAYRFCLSNAAFSSVLSGTGNLQHLEENIQSFAKSKLSQDDIKMLNQLFQGVASLSGQ